MTRGDLAALIISAIAAYVLIVFFMTGG